MSDNQPGARGNTDPRRLELGPHGSLRFQPPAQADGRRLEAELRIDPPDGNAEPDWPLRFAGIEYRLYAEVEGLGRATTLLDATASVSTPAAIVHRLVFEFSTEQIDSIRLGADLGFGVDDDRMRVGVRAGGASRRALLEDFD